MLLQTLVQLNILILATPALAGWSLLPPAHLGTVHAAGIVRQFRAAESAAPRAEQAQPCQTERRASAAPCPLPVPAPASGFPATDILSLPAIPHAARAP